MQIVHCPMRDRSRCLKYDADAGYADQPILPAGMLPIPKFSTLRLDASHMAGGSQRDSRISCNPQAGGRGDGHCA